MSVFRRMRDWVLLFAVVMAGAAHPAYGDEASMKPMYPPMVADEASLLKQWAAFLEMPESELLALVPPQGGFYFQDCPACDQGDEATQLT